MPLKAFGCISTLRDAPKSEEQTPVLIFTYTSSKLSDNKSIAGQIMGKCI